MCQENIVQQAGHHSFWTPEVEREIYHVVYFAWECFLRCRTALEPDTKRPVWPLDVTVYVHAAPLDAK